jgi:ubiquinone biosynthesis protein
LWATAKPILENWMNEQIGFKAMFTKIKHNAPFWCEKLPDMPDLLFNTLQQLKALPELQEKQFREQQALQRKHQKSTLYGMLGSTGFILALLMFANGMPLKYELGLTVFGAYFWVKAIIKSRE